MRLYNRTYSLETYTMSLYEQFRNFIESIVSKIKRHFQNYIDKRMDGMPYYSPKKDPVFSDKTSSKEHTSTPIYSVSQSTDALRLLQMPTYLKEGIGKYGKEITGTLETSTGESVEILQKYIDALQLPYHKTFRIFENDVSSPAYEAIQHIKYSTLFIQLSKGHSNHFIFPIVPMNELFVSCLDADDSDCVFESPHIDGVFAWLPWCTVLRCVVAIRGHRNIQTVFPLSQNTYTLKTGDFLVFDYNRSIHYICGSEQITEKHKRIILKLHYLVYPDWLPLWLSKLYTILHCKYNTLFRDLFVNSRFTSSLDCLITNAPQTYSQQCLASIIRKGVILYVKIFLVFTFLAKWVIRGIRPNKTG